MQGKHRTLASDQGRENWLWLTPALVAILVVSCLGFGVINAGSGFRTDGQVVHYRLVSAVTNYPFCPPEIPCPISVILNEDHWVVWGLRDVQTSKGVETSFRKLIDIRLWVKK